MFVPRVLVALAVWAALAVPFADAAGAQMSLLHYDSVAYAIKSGSGPQPVIFITGLASGTYVYDAEIKRLSAHHTTYAVEFAGFNGEPPVPPPFLDRFEQSIVHLIRDQKLEGAVLVGEHFGGQVALRVASDVPKRIAGVVVIDSMPAGSLAPANPAPGDVTAAVQREMARYAAMPKREFVASTTVVARSLVGNPNQAQSVAAHMVTDDAATLGGVLAEYGAIDIRPRLRSISAPVLLLSAYGEPVPEAEWARVFTAFYAGTPQFTIRGIGPSHHLVMFDQPQQFQSAVEAFLETLSRKGSSA